LQISEQQLISLNDNLSQLTNSLTPSDRAVADAADELNGLLPVLRKFLDENGHVLTTDVNNLATATTPLVQPDQQNALETYPARVSDVRGQRQQHLPPQPRCAHDHPGHHQLRQSHSS